MMHSYAIRRPHAAALSFTPAQMAQMYSFPKVTEKTPQTIALIELGGGYDPAKIAAQFAKWGLPAPKITDLGVLGAKNDYTGDPQSADVEVELDICCVGAYSYSTGQPVNVLVIFAPNTDAGFIAAINACIGKASTCGISWGGPEDQWPASSRTAMDAAFKAATDAGVTFCCASGDNGSGDGEQGDHADYPGSSPYVVCCGGTTIITSPASLGHDPQITNEVVWNAGGGASGGGYSAFEAAPAYQTGFIPAGKKRGVPDLAAAADPATGWDTPFGTIGGTSAVAPFIAAYFAVLKAAGVALPGAVNPLLYENEPTFRDLVLGNNGSFSATKGWDAATGLGALVGDALYAKLSGGTPLPPPPPPPPPPPVGTKRILQILLARGFQLDGKPLSVPHKTIHTVEVDGTLKMDGKTV